MPGKKGNVRGEKGKRGKTGKITLKQGEKMESIVMPGEMLWEEEARVPNTYIDGGRTYASVMGMMRDGKFIPLEMVYHPKPGDNVVGVVTNVRHAGFSVDMNLAHEGFISSKFTRVSFKQGDMIYGRLKFVDEVGSVDISDANRLPVGKLVPVPASKVPRIIGKRSSMLNVIRDGTGCSIFVGNNGYIWIGGKGNLQLALKTIDFIIENAHTQGLTNAVAEYLNENGGNVKVPSREEEVEKEGEGRGEVAGREGERKGESSQKESSGGPGEAESRAGEKGEEGREDKERAQGGGEHTKNCFDEECF
jgi:exosome complex component RRP4